VAVENALKMADFPMEHQLQMEDFHGFSIATFDCGSVTNSTKGKG